MVFNILVDPGEGVVNNLYSVGLGIADIDMVVATHDHPDHITALDALVSLRGEQERIGGEGATPTASRSTMVILGNRSVHERYDFLNDGGSYTVQHIRDVSYLFPNLAGKHLESELEAGKRFADGALLTMTPLATNHKDHAGHDAVGFVLQLAVPSKARPMTIAFMSDTGVEAFSQKGGAPTTARSRLERQRWEEALASDIVVAHVSDVPSDEIRRLAILTTEDAERTSFDKGVGELATHRREEAERLMHALSIAALERTKERLVPERLLEGRSARADDAQHLYLEGLLDVAHRMKAKKGSADADWTRTDGDRSTRVLVIGEFREELGSFRGTIAREVNVKVFKSRPEKSELVDPVCVAVTADIGLRIRLGNEGARNRVLCSTCSLNNDRLDVERFHPPEKMREVCVKGDHEAMYWSCQDHDPGMREPSVFVEQMGGYDPFSAGGRYHG